MTVGSLFNFEYRNYCKKTAIICGIETIAIIVTSTIVLS